MPLGEQTVSHKRGQKYRLPDTYINKDYALYKLRLCKCFKVYEDYIKFDAEQAENIKSSER